MNSPFTKALAACSALFLLTCSVEAQTLTLTTTAPTTGQIVGQSNDSAGAQSNADYSNNPSPGQTFTAPAGFSSLTMTSFTLQFAGSNQDQDGGSGTFNFQIGSVDGGNITPLQTGSVSTASVPDFTTNYATFTLATPLALTSGTVYAISIYSAAQNEYFGFAGSPNGGTDFYPGGTAFDNAFTGGFSNSVATTLNYDRTFFIGGMGVPEPSTVALSVLAAGAFFFVLRRRAVANR